MNRQVLLLSLLGVVLLVVAFFFLLWQPKADELALIEEDIDAAIAQQATLEARIRDLQVVRERAPELEAELAAVDAVIPRDAALPSALRQLQLAADDSGVELLAVSPGRPAAVEGDAVDLANITLSVTVNGGYFQVVDFLRRVSDPAITPRGVLWDSVSVAASEYPSLAVNLVGEMFAIIPEALPAEVEPEPEADVTVTVEDEEAA